MATANFKKNQSVNYKTQRGNTGRGQVRGSETHANGTFYHVMPDGAEKGAAPLKLRASQLQPA